MSGLLYPMHFNNLLSTCSYKPSTTPRSCSAPPPGLSGTRPPSSRCEMAPLCNICSYKQGGDRIRPVYHLHNSPREIRILQGVEYSTSNPSYMCTTCTPMHPIKQGSSQPNFPRSNQREFPIFSRLVTKKICPDPPNNYFLLHF